MKNLKFLVSLVFSLFLLTNCSSGQNGQTTAVVNQPSDWQASKLFLELIHETREIEVSRKIQTIEKHWQPSFATMVIETVYLSQDPVLSYKLIEILQKKSGKSYGYAFRDWFYWLWNNKEEKAMDYADFKAGLYKVIDPKFEQYFLGRNDQSKIRLDEVRWGGVVQDGIPLLRNPNMINAEEASYLDGDNVVFGIELNGDVRAYPKRILAWHEMFVDEVGGVPVAGVYCTLCGTVILYKTEFEGVNHQMGTSGFLYRSNKLMYDQATQSLWNTLQGAPVIGPLIDQNIELEHLSVVTTTWAEWVKRHPDTKVLSLQTGYNRDYGEGVAYHDYFSSDKLMFNTPFKDKRLKNKQEILAIRLPQYPSEQLAISTNFLNKNTIYHDRIGNQDFVVFTDKSGANRVFEIDDHLFAPYDKQDQVIDSNNIKWTLTESKLISESGEILDRLPYHRAFWFGWFAAFPDTRLVK